jgi:hypothetical protein
MSKPSHIAYVVTESRGEELIGRLSGAKSGLFGLTGTGTASIFCFTINSPSQAASSAPSGRRSPTTTGPRKGRERPHQATSTAAWDTGRLSFGKTVAQRS